MIVYGRNAVGQAIRGLRRASSMAPAHQGVCADVEAYRYADAADLLAAPEPVLVGLDEVTDRRTWARSAGRRSASAPPA